MKVQSKRGRLAIILIPFFIICFAVATTFLVLTAAKSDITETERYQAVSTKHISWYENGEGYTVGHYSGWKNMKGSLEIPSSYKGKPVTRINSYAFDDFYGLTSVTIPDTVTEIGEYAFRGCKGLTEILIPDSVTSIGSSAFQNCESLTKVTLSSNLDSLEEDAFSGCESLTIISIPESVTELGSSAFYHCPIEEATIPVSFLGEVRNEFLKKVTITGEGSIKNDALSSCKNLTSVTMEKGITSIGDRAFIYCEKLCEITIPEGVTRIGNFAFQNCESLKRINIPSTVTEVGVSAFLWCPIEQATLPLVAFDVHTHDDKAHLKTLVITNGSTLKDYALSGCSKITSVTLPSELKYIGREAFYQCIALEDIYYQGTQAEWDLITKGLFWDEQIGDSYTIHCTDGDIEK